MAYPCMQCMNNSDLDECIHCNNGSNFLSDEEPIQCPECGHYGYAAKCNICGYDVANMASTATSDEYNANVSIH
jgi:DNA-directed RNA polymerase subunit RPC12/RpoP